MRSRGLVMVVCCILWSSRASAEQDPNTAEGALQSAAELMAEGQCEGAIPLLLRAYRLGGLRNALWNIAECYRTLDRPGLAIDTYRTYLEHAETRRNQRDRAAARAAIDRLLPQVARVTIVSSVEHATVSVDGQPIGEAPIVTHLGRGLRNIEVSSPGFTTWRQQVQIEPGEERELRADLDLQPGQLTVSSQPSGAEFRVDGEPGGVTPDTISVAGGGHIVEVSLRGHRTAQRRVTVPSGQQIAIEVPMTPTQGVLAVATDVIDAALEVDGEERGTSPFAPLSLSPGRHRLEVDAPRHESWAGEVDIIDQRTTMVEVELSSTSGVHQAGFWTLAVSGLAGIIGGVVLFFTAGEGAANFNAIANDIEGGGESARDLAEMQQYGEEVASEARVYGASGLALIGVGSAAALSAVVLAFFTRFRGGSSSASVRVEGTDDGSSLPADREVEP